MKIQLKLPMIFLALALMLSSVPVGITVGYAADAVCDDKAEFIAHVSVPDGSNFAPGTAFTKTWKLKNIGTCTWATTYSAVFDSGEKMGGPASVNLPVAVAPGQTVDLSMGLTAPAAPGVYIGYWKLKNDSGALFGTGTPADKPFSVNICVTGPALVSGDYNFVTNAACAKWSTNSGDMPFPGADGDARGYASTGLHWIFEDGISSPEYSILVGPQNVSNGFIQGVYPPITVQAGDVFKAQIGCAYLSTTCYVAYRLKYQIVEANGALGEVKTLWKEPPFRERYEGKTYIVTQSLNSLVGKNVQFILSVSDYDGNAAGDRALWGNPRIVRSAPPPPPAGCTDIAKFKSDLDVADGKMYAPGQTFTKTWELQNIGTCAWTTAYQLVFDSGVSGSNRMGGPETAFLTISVAPRDTVKISVNLTAPTTGGTYIGYWKFKNDKGVSFALAPFGNIYLGNQKSFWVRINVVGTGTVP